MFKRRNPRSTLRIIAEAFWPKGGWGRAFSYIRHRLRRLPDPPHRIARGIAAGIIASFTPFFGFHFLTAALIGWVMRGNLLAAMLTTFIGNPLTFPLIATLSLRTGTWVLGRNAFDRPHHGVIDSFTGALGDLWSNFLAIFTSDRADWHHLSNFYHDVFFPYLVGGLIPGVIFAVITYYAILPFLIAYQKRRKGRLKERFDALRAKKASGADAPPDPS